MGLLSRLSGNKMSKDKLFHEVGTMIFNEVHGRFSLKITQGIAGDADGNSEQEAYMEVTDMILRGDLSRNDLKGMGEAYMQLRENIIINRGGIPRWVPKEEKSIQELIKQDGIEHATRRFAEVICEMLNTKENAYQFILEEVEAASGGNIAAMKFAAESGILPEEYSGAMQNSIPEIDGENGPQQFLLDISSQLMSNTDLMVKFRTQIAENVMKKFQLGKFIPPF